MYLTEVGMTKGQEKTKRVLAALERCEPDRVPVGEFFWTNFLKRAKNEAAGLPARVSYH